MSVAKQTDRIEARLGAPRPGREYFSETDRRTQHQEDASAWLTVTLELIGVVGLGVAGMAITVAWIILAN